MSLTETELDALLSGLTPPLAEAIADLERQVAAMGARIKALEQRPALAYEGIYDAEKSYQKGHVVTCAGSTWLATADHVRSVRPGDDSEVARQSWRLVAARGRPGKDGRDR